MMSYGPVGAHNDQQRADFGGVLTALGMRDELNAFGEKISRVERDLLWEQRHGLEVPSYVVDALREAVEPYDARTSSP